MDRKTTFWIFQEKNMQNLIRENVTWLRKGNLEKEV